MTHSGIDFAAARARFPALTRVLDQSPCVFADAPGGTQVPEDVITAMTAYLSDNNANVGGAFVTSEETGEVVTGARRAAADLLGGEPEEIVFGPNMTSLAFHLARSLVQNLGHDDEVVVTRLDHDANVAPWTTAAEDVGALVHHMDIHEDDCTLDLASLEEVLNESTKIVAVTAASNAVGSVTDLAEVARLVRDTEALLIVDGVHYTPHRAVDVAALGADVFFCSPYKFFGPHLGIMWARRDLLSDLSPYKVRPATDEVPGRWENGTKNHEALAGLTAAVDYLAGLAGDGDRRTALTRSGAAIETFEAEMSRRFIERIDPLDKIRLYGIPGTDRLAQRTPTFALTVEGRSPREVAEHLGRRGVFVWDGNYYALEIMERLGLEDSGGAVRIGFCHYNTLEEVDRVVEELAAL